MIRNVLPSLGSTIISLFKDTSLAAAIAVPELTFEARKINVETFRVIETWIVASCMYVATCTALAAVMRQVERRMARPEVDAMDPVRFAEMLWLARMPILKGLGLTVSISALAIVAGTVLGMIVGLSLMYGVRPLRWLVRGYTDFIRGTPVLVLVLASYYVLSTVGLDLTAFQAGVLALTVFCSSHVGEILRGALQSIPAGQTEAAKAIGLTFRQTFFSVLGPAGAASGAAGLGQHRRRDGQGLDPAVDHRRQRASPAHAGADLAHAS